MQLLCILTYCVKYSIVAHLYMYMKWIYYVTFYGQPESGCYSLPKSG